MKLPEQSVRTGTIRLVSQQQQKTRKGWNRSESLKVNLPVAFKGGELYVWKFWSHNMKRRPHDYMPELLMMMIPINIPLHVSLLFQMHRAVVWVLAAVVITFMALLHSSHAIPFYPSPYNNAR